MSAMISEPETYFRQFAPMRNDLLKKMEDEAQREQIPIIGPFVGELLFILARAARARKILELGTAIGYSTLFLAEACASAQGTVVTLEMNPQMAARAEANFRQAGLEGIIELKMGDAFEVLESIHNQFDMIFMDIEKLDYIRALPHCRRLLARGGLLVADNTGFSDADAFNRAIAADAGFRSMQLLAFLPLHSPEKDGLCIALRL
jgi:caffeoyl-CoA O-methyltransferase